MKKSITILVLLYACCMNLLAYSFEKDNIYYNITSSTNKEVEVTFRTDDVSTDTYIGEITIPESVTHDNVTYKVTGIAYKAFYQEDKLLKLSLPSTIKTIEGYAFSYCDLLISVSVRGSSSIETLGKQAFAGCPSLQTVPDFSNISILQDYVFYQCSKLEKVVFSSKLTKIGIQTFDRCYQLQSAGNLSNVTSVGDYAFSVCRNLQFNTTDFSQITSVGYAAFEGCEKLESINLSNATIKTRNDESSAFAGCTNLKTVTFPKTATNIPARIFSGCTNLETVVFYDTNKITFIGTSAFRNCHKLKTFPNISAATSIGNEAFNQCHSLEIERLTIPDVTTYLGDRAFMGCPGIRHLTIGNGITEIKQRTFANQTGTGNEIVSEDYRLESIAFGNNIKTIQEGAFMYCTKIQEIILPQSVETFGNYIFHGCKSLTNADLSETQIKKLPKYSFSGAPFDIVFQSQKQQDGKALKNRTNAEYDNKNALILPPTIEIIEDYAFSDCINLQEVSLNGSLITEIGQYSFKGCNNLTSFTIDNSNIKEIKDYAFSGMSGLTSFKIPSSVERIGKQAFYGCTGLTSINIPSKVTTIDICAFYGCTGLTSINIPSRVTTIGRNAFYNCTGLTAVNIANLETWCNLSFTYSSDNPLYYAKHLYLNGEEIKELTIPSSIKTIGDYQFYNCEGLTTINLPDSLTSIGNNAFDGCTGLTSISLPDSIKTMGRNAFHNCTGLTAIHIPSLETWCNLSFTYSSDNPLYYAKHLYLNGEEIKELTIPNSIKTIGDYQFYSCEELTVVNLPNSLTTIGNNAFAGCKGLTSISLPDSIKTIGGSAFSGCKELTAIHIPSLETWCNLSFTYSSDNPLYYAKHLYLNGEEIKELTIPNRIKTIGNYQFHNCEGITTVNLPDSLTSIGNNAFDGCKGLTTINLPDSLKTIGKYAFDGCKGLTTIYIPKNLTSIGENAFSWCYNIENIYSFAKVPISCEENIFTSTVYNYATLHVPAGSESSYSQTTPWNKFKIKSIPTSIENTISGDKDLENVDVYTTDGNLFKKSFNFKNNAKELPSNIYIINEKKYLVK